MAVLADHGTTPLPIGLFTTVSLSTPMPTGLHGDVFAPAGIAMRAIAVMVAARIAFFIERTLSIARRSIEACACRGLARGPQGFFPRP